MAATGRSTLGWEKKTASASPKVWGTGGACDVSAGACDSAADGADPAPLAPSDGAEVGTCSMTKLLAGDGPAAAAAEVCPSVSALLAAAMTPRRREEGADHL
jgi:hypothetical protein